MIYLDNSATTRKKPKQVIDAILKGLTTLAANPGRGGHAASINAAIAVSEVREKLCKYFGCASPENVIFTQNCTDSLNLAILGTAKQGGHVITTAFEHNSTLRPLHELEAKGIIELTVVQPKSKSEITAYDIEKHIKPNTYLISTVHISNVDGAITNISEIGKICKEKGILYLVDAAQSGGHECINMQKQNISYLAIAGHKGLFGPQGIGALLTAPNAPLNPIRFGGTGTQSIKVTQPNERPECFESGTLALPNILGLGAGVDFVMNNQEKIDFKIKYLTKLLLNELKKLKNVKIYTNDNNLFGVVAFNIVGVDSEIVCEFLNDKFSICVRSGLQCAPLKHKHLGTVETGVVRVSLSYLSTEEEIRMLIYGLQSFMKNFNL